MVAMLIDAHTHIFPLSMQRRRGELLQSDPGFSALYSQKKAAMAGAEEVITQLQEHSLNKAVVSGFSWHSLDHCRESNDYLLEACREYAD
ncbi:MAG TPA: hypothetical protein PLG17_06025, partial [Thermodesulfobacteriota bacterium]|nr:hypothetical protein [Thermodesulfobacteriota bacterium]